MERTKEELAVLNHYGITKFSQFTKDMLLDLQSRLTEMNPEVAKAVLAQVPGYLQFTNERINGLNGIISEVIKSENHETDLNYEMSNKLMDIYGKQLDREDSSSEERVRILESLAEVKRSADINAAEKRQHHEWLTFFSGCVAGAGMFAVGSWLGGRSILRFPVRI